MKTINRQAVIVVHGMGEQRPMDTLRGFVEGVKWQLELNDPKGEVPVQVRSKPDSIGDIYETVRLSMEGNYKGKIPRPITDFYEFYWAQNMRGTQFSQMGTWLRQVIFKWVSQIPKQLRRVWWTVWGIFVISGALTAGYTFFLPVPGIFKAVAFFFGGSIVSFIWTAVASFFKTSFLNSLGDVARYMTPEPDNIADRSAIRQQGIAFLKKMHDLRNRTRPDRIIVVAHSLGTAVAYDLLRLLWTEHNTIYTLPASKQPKLSVVNKLAVNPAMIGTDFTSFKAAQNQLWNETQQLGNPWLITDFITLGAALSAIDYFMVSNVKTDALIAQRELPVCPPQIDSRDKLIYYKQYLAQPGAARRKSVNVLHHGALFAVTRWTNIFFTSDFVGGPMQRIFGKGVEDIPIKRKSLWCYPGGHTDYWNKNKQNALKEVVEALRLS